MHGRVHFLIEELKQSLIFFNFVSRNFSLHRCGELVEATKSSCCNFFFLTIFGRNAALDKGKATLDDVTVLSANFAKFSIHFFSMYWHHNHFIFFNFF